MTIRMADIDQPHADIRNGQAFLNEVYTAVTNSPAWRRTLLVINDANGAAFRARGVVAHSLFDHTSMLGRQRTRVPDLNSRGAVSFHFDSCAAPRDRYGRLIFSRAWDRFAVTLLVLR